MDDDSSTIARAGVGLWTWMVGDDRVSWTETALSLYRTDAAPANYESFLELVHPDDRGGLAAAVQQALSHASEHRAPGRYVVEHRLAKAADDPRWLEVRGSVDVDVDGQPARMTGVVLDCTKRKKSELALQQNTESFRRYAELASDYVYRVDLPELAPTVVVGSFERTTGMTMEDVAAAGGWPALIHPEDRPAIDDVMATVSAGKPSIAEYRIVTKSGAVRWLRDRIRPVVDQQSGVTVRIWGAVQDITEQKQLEAQLVAARKRDALAQFSGAIAHDFNNLLTVILSSAEMVKRSAAAEDARFLDAIDQAGHKAAELTRSLLLFGRQDSGSPKVLDLREFIARTEPLLHGSVRHPLATSMGDGALHVRIDETQAQLLLLNLVVNAGHAMEGREGEIALTVDERDVGPHDPERPPELPPGRYVAMSVRDEGDGIPPEVLPHIFEPFFTTRAPGKGTGLGLATCQGIVAQAHGAIAAKNLREQGACFTVWLPHTRAEAAAVTPELRVSTGGTESLLLVEDHATLRELFSRALQERGYDVVVCASAEEALEVLEDRRFDMMVTDVIMQGRGGLALADEVAERWENTRVLLLSGTATKDTPTPHELVLKPVTPEGLARRIREVLDRR